MAKLIYVSPLSLDGYLGDGNYDWSNPGEDGHNFITEVMRPVGTYLYGRKMYETMSFWEAANLPPALDPAMQNFANLWQAADKIVYSKSMKSVSYKKTRLEREFNLNSIREMKAQLTRDISIGGANLAAQAIRAGLVDEYHLFVVPRMIGGGIRVLPENIDIELKLIEERPFGSGWVYLRYQTISSLTQS